jgi:hypothetical protein
MLYFLISCIKSFCRFFTIILYSAILEYCSRKWLFIFYIATTLRNVCVLKLYQNTFMLTSYIFSLLLRNYSNSPGTFYNKPRLLILIASVVVSLSVVPFILPHLFHQHMIYHILMHLGTLILSQFLAVVSILAYLKSKTTRILFMALGFVTLVVAEYVYLLNSTEDMHPMFLSQVNIELSHLILLIMVIFFGISFLKSPQVKQV